MKDAEKNFCLPVSLLLTDPKASTAERPLQKNRWNIHIFSISDNTATAVRAPKEMELVKMGENS